MVSIRCSICIAVLVLAGCSTNPVAVEDAGGQASGTGTQAEAEVEERSQTPKIEQAPAPANRASQSLHRFAETHYERQEYQAVVSVAERLLRINRSDSRAYLLLAQSYRALGEPERALQFAQQGLLYSGSSAAETVEELRQIRDALR